MKLHSLRVAAALTAALTTAFSPLLVSAQTAYEYKKYTPGLVVMGIGSGQAPGSGENGSPPLGLRLSANAINFGDVATNTTETRQVLVSNPGTGSLSFTAAPAVTGDAAFAAGLTTCGSSLAVGADCLTDATFSPTNVGTYNGVLKFSSVLASSPHEVALVGTAFNPVSLAGATLPDGMVGKAFSFDFKTLLNVSNEANPDKNQANWSGTGTLPAGVTLNTNTGVLSGIPSAVTPQSSYTVIGTYKNNQGQQVYTIRVGEAVLEVTQISAGSAHTCAVTPSGGAKCWGYNSYGQLGDGTTVNKTTPVDVLGLTAGVASIDAGGSHTCALTTAGGAKCWGSNGNGQLGDNSTTQRKTPIDVLGLTAGVASIDAGSSHTCALTTAGGAKCWGYNGQGQLGDGSAIQRTSPGNVSGLTSGVTILAVGYAHACVVTTVGAVKCWGSNYSLSPGSVAGLASGVASLAAGDGHTCAVTAAGGAKCWGANAYGQLGDNSTTNRWSPGDVAGLTSGVSRLTAGTRHTCALMVAGDVKCWGSNADGQLGDNSTITRYGPVPVTGLASGVRTISAGNAHTCAVTTSGGMKCWGNNAFGLLGDGTTAQRTAPVNVLP
jgi:alpha-tubulin suppressor-like RCC1 family protein